MTLRHRYRGHGGRTGGPITLPRRGLLLALTLAVGCTAPPGGGNCHPSYTGVCLTPGIGDYDCAGGSGNGPHYVSGPFQVVGFDEYGLDGDGDGTGCE